MLFQMEFGIRTNSEGMEKHVSCINVRPVIQYVEHNAPNRVSDLLGDLGEELEGIPDPKSYLSDENNWVSSTLFLTLIEKAKSIFCDEDLAYKIGLSTVENRDLGYLQRVFIRAFGSPYRGLKQSQKVNDQFNRTKKIEIVSLAKDSGVLRLRWFKNLKLSIDFCKLNKGIYRAIPGIWSLPYAELQEKKCFFKGDEYCEYHLQWKSRGQLRYLLRRVFLPWSLIKSSTAELEHDKAVLKKKYDQIYHLNRNLHQRISQLEILHDTSNAILSTMDIDELLDLILKKLLKVANLDRAAIFLLNKTNDILVPIHAVGVEDELFYEIQNYTIPVSKEDNIIARSIRAERPIVIKDIEKISLNPKNVLLQKFNPKAFVLVPISVKGKVIGIMVGDNSTKQHALAEIDTNFLASFANHIAMTMENANLYRKLQESEKKYRQIVENANEGIILIQPDGRILFSNRYFKELLGYDSFDNMKLYDLVEEKNQHIILSILENSLQHQTTDCEVVLKGNNNSKPHVHLSNVPMVSEKEFRGTLSIVTDLTEKKQMERRLLLSQKMESIGTMAGGIAHDFNNLLTGILGFTQLLRDETDDNDKTRSYFEIIDTSGEKAIKLIKKLLEFSTGSEANEEQKADLSDVVIETVELFDQSEPKDIECVVDIPGDLSPLYCEPMQLQRVFHNLLINAGDVLEDGGKITVTAETLDPNRYGQVFGTNGNYSQFQCVHIIVADNGPGMTPEVKERIFDPFFTTKVVGKGTGLGLSVVYGIVKKCNGVIDVDSKPGEGATFHIYLPFVDSDQKETDENDFESLSGSTPELETILVVDDDKLILELAKKMLEGLGYSVIIAENGFKAIELYRHMKEKIDLVIVDVQMPGMGGVKTTALLKEIDPSVKLIMCSGQGEYTFDDACQSDRLITKPFQLMKMTNTIREVLDS